MRGVMPMLVSDASCACLTAVESLYLGPVAFIIKPITLALMTNHDMSIMIQLLVPQLPSTFPNELTVDTFRNGLTLLFQSCMTPSRCAGAASRLLEPALEAGSVRELPEAANNLIKEAASHTSASQLLAAAVQVCR